MSFQRHLRELGGLFNFPNLSTFTQNMPVEWLAPARHLSKRATVRRRRLPCDQVRWLALGMALFRDEPVHELVRRGVTEARKRLGADPVEWQFGKTGRQWGGERYGGDAWQGMQVFAVDATLLRPGFIAVQMIVMAAAKPISAPGRRLSALRAERGGWLLDTVQGPHGQGR